jgi:GNAT superfamily N-acetyltransferase
MRLSTERLVLEDPTDDDLDGLLAVALSNPEFLATHEGSGGEPGAYDRDMLERDLTVAALDPARHPLVIRLRAAGHIVGRAEVLDDHPRDHLPWLGLLELHADRHGEGFGAEATGVIVDWARKTGASALRLGVDDGNDRALEFWVGRGFTPVDRRERPGPQGPLGVTVLERQL